VRTAGLLLALGAAGCASTPPAIGEPGAQVPDRRAEAQYRAVLERVSDHREVYDGLDTRLFAAATYQSVEFREARVRRQAQFQTWPEPKLDQALVRERAEAAQAHDVVLGVNIVDRRFDDLDSKGTIWRISLVTDQGEVTPIEVRRVGRANADMRAYYPYLGDFWTMYTVRFPLGVAGRPLVGPETRTLAFRLSSTQGQVEMHFPATSMTAQASGEATPVAPAPPKNP
jgi:hypothetical protein